MQPEKGPFTGILFSVKHFNAPEWPIGMCDCESWLRCVLVPKQSFL